MKSLTKQEAIKALNEGKRLSHRLFTPDEWIERGGKGIICEDGASIPEYIFWSDREHPNFEIDWYIIDKS